MKFLFKPILSVLVMGFGVLYWGQAHALTFGFSAITDNSPGNPAIGESQLFVDVTDSGAISVNDVLFTFRNMGPLPSSTYQVHFDDDSLLAFESLIVSDEGKGGDAGADFSQGTTPPNLPVGKTARRPLVNTAGLLADSDPAAAIGGTRRSP